MTKLKNIVKRVCLKFQKYYNNFIFCHIFHIIGISTVSVKIKIIILSRGSEGPLRTFLQMGRTFNKRIKYALRGQNKLSLGIINLYQKFFDLLVTFWNVLKEAIHEFSGSAPYWELYYLMKVCLIPKTLVIKTKKLLWFYRHHRVEVKMIKAVL